ncbi:MAG: sulfite exporter TauE/SafE family protein [Sphingobacteriales bacterium]|nr:MAG: sulfite exporter TauE/SafE family protein [Sphingobacteriales bacterium]
MNPEISNLIFLLLLFLVAFLYSSVGHGGASGYLALMGIYHLTPDVMKPSALMLNIVVSFIAFIQYSRTTSINKKLLLLLILGSVPAAFIGAGITLDVLIYKKVLGVLLLFPILRLLGFFGMEVSVLKNPNPYLAVSIGITIGFISGVIGIGGGILLSPILLFLGWAFIKQTAVISSLFIFLNSISGMIGLVSKGISIDNTIYLWIATAVVGGIAGSYFGAKIFDSTVLKKVLAVVLVIASLKLITG